MAQTLQRTSKYPPKTLVKLTPVQVFTATFVDGEQYHDTRFVAVVGDRVHFLHPEGVDSNIKAMAGWLKDAIVQQSKSVSIVTESDLVKADDAVDPMG